MTIVDKFYEKHLINFREDKRVLLMFHQLCKKLPGSGKEMVRAVSTEVCNSILLAYVKTCIRWEYTSIGLIVQESVATATSTNMSSTVLITKGKSNVNFFFRKNAFPVCNESITCILHDYDVEEYYVFQKPY